MDVNPKSIKTEELYGFISMATREWKDGLLSKASVIFAKFFISRKVEYYARCFVCPERVS